LSWAASHQLMSALHVHHPSRCTRNGSSTGSSRMTQCHRAAGRQMNGWGTRGMAWASPAYTSSRLASKAQNMIQTSRRHSIQIGHYKALARTASTTTAHAASRWFSFCAECSLRFNFFGNPAQLCGHATHCSGHRTPSAEHRWPTLLAVRQQLQHQ